MSSTPSTSTQAPGFSGTKTFQKSIFKQYGILLIAIPFLFFAVWTAFSEPEYRVGALLAGLVSAAVTCLPFFQVNSVKVEPNKLTIETFFEEKEFSAPQIKEIKMKSIRGRYGRV